MSPFSVLYHLLPLMLQESRLLLALSHVLPELPHVFLELVVFRSLVAPAGFGRFFSIPVYSFKLFSKGVYLVGVCDPGLA